jgi:hypothetical protein
MIKCDEKSAKRLKYETNFYQIFDEKIEDDFDEMYTNNILWMYSQLSRELKELNTNFEECTFSDLPTLDSNSLLSILDNINWQIFSNTDSTTLNLLQCKPGVNLLLKYKCKTAKEYLNEFIELYESSEDRVIERLNISREFLYEFRDTLNKTVKFLEDRMQARNNNSIIYVRET